MRHSKKVIGITILLIIGSIFLIPLMGREFLPIMDEGTMLINATLPPGTSLEESKRIGDQIEKALHEFPEVVSTSNRTGRAEEDEHAEGVNSNEIVVNLLPPEKRKKSREELLTLFRERLKEFSGVVVNIGQPIQHRLDHLLSGVNAQLAIKLFGSDLNVLRAKAEEIRRAISTVPGVADLFVEQQVEVPQLKIWINRKEAARYGLSVTDISHFVETAFKGETVSQILQGQRRYNLVAILESQSRSDVEKIKQLLINTPSGSVVPLERVTDIQFEPGPTTINRENVSRMMVVQCNVSGRDLGGFVNEVQARINKNVSFPEGYFVSYGGQFESQQRAFQKLLIELFFIVLAMYVLLYVTLGSGRIALLVMLNVPLSLIGGIVAIYLVSGVLSVSSFSGFILLFGIAMRNGIILVTHINDLRYKEGLGLLDAILKGTNDRLSPVLMTALAAGLGMVPLAIAQGSGAELQKPLAIVIVGGMLTSTALTLLVLPVLYYLAEKRGENQKPPENLEEPKPGVLKPEALPTVQEVMKF
jgi:CzcA family heavy metal efflux pump